MGLFARFTCLRMDGSAADLADTVRGLLRERTMVETSDPAAEERLVLIASAGDGWLMVADRLEQPTASFDDPDGLIAELNASHAGMAIEVSIADSDDLVLRLIEHGHEQSQLALDTRGRLDGHLQPWQRVLMAERTVDDLRAALAKQTTFVEEHLSEMETLLGLDLGILAGKPPAPGAVVLRFRAAPAPGQTIGPPALKVDQSQREITIRNKDFLQIPLGLVCHFPAFKFQSRGGAARGLEIRLFGSALDQELIEPVSALIKQQHPTNSELDRTWRLPPDPSSRFRVPDLAIPDWVHLDHRSAVGARTSLHDVLVFIYVRCLKVGEGELTAEAFLLEPPSAPARLSYPVTVLPGMWRPLRSRDQPDAIWAIKALNRPARINGLAVLCGGPDHTAAALREVIDAWLSFADQRQMYSVSAEAEASSEANFYSPYHTSKSFAFDLGESGGAEWNRLLAGLPSVAALHIHSMPRDTSTQAMDELFATGAGLHYLAPRQHPRLPEFAARLGHVAVSFPANPASEAAIIALMEALASDGHVVQAYVASHDGEDGPESTLYEKAADLRGHYAVAYGWGTRYLRAVADHLWLGPSLSTLIEDRAALERVAIVKPLGSTLGIERRPNATLRDIEWCIAPLLPTQDDLRTFSERILGPKPAAS